MNPIFTAALQVQAFCRDHGWPFCFIGGVAVQRWGEPRGTQNVDVTVFTGFGSEEAYVDALVTAFAARRQDARAFALEYRVVLLRTASGVPVDVALGAMPFEERAVSRATDFAVQPGVVLTVCSAEDLIVFKAFAGRERDWLDIESIMLRRRRSLDVALIWRELTPRLELKEAPETAERLGRLLAGTGR